MSEADAFLDAIFDAPDEDTPRLVYADWLQENGQDNYAEFIRLQCAAARCKVWSDDANNLWVQIGRVWNRLSNEWRPISVEEFSWERLDAVHFHRGFLRSDIPIAAEWLLRYPDCWPWLPTPGAMIEFEWDIDLTRLATVPLLRRLRTIRFGGQTWEDETGNDRHPRSSRLDPLLGSPHLSRLRVLDLSGFGLDRSTAEILLTAHNLGSVESLEVRFEGGGLDRKALISQLDKRFKRMIPHVTPEPPPPPPLPPPFVPRATSPGDDDGDLPF